jgi:hypothetical protein
LSRRACMLKWGARGPEFKSRRPDQSNQELNSLVGLANSATGTSLPASELFSWIVTVRSQSLRRGAHSPVPVSGRFIHQRPQTPRTTCPRAIQFIYSSRGRRGRGSVPPPLPFGAQQRDGLPNLRSHAARAGTSVKGDDELSHRVRVSATDRVDDPSAQSVISFGRHR